MAPNKIAVEEVLIFFVVQISQVSISIVKDVQLPFPKIYCLEAASADFKENLH